MIRQFQVLGGSAVVPYALARQARPFRLLAVSGTVVAAVATINPRTITLYVIYGGVANVWSCPASFQVADGTTGFFTFGATANVAQINLDNTTTYGIAPTPPFLITPEMEVAVGLISADAADTLTGLSFLIEER